MKNKLYYITYVIGENKEDVETCLQSLKREYQNYNVKFIPTKIDEIIYGINFIGTFEEVLKVALDFKPLGEYIEEPYTDYIREL